MPHAARDLLPAPHLLSVLLRDDHRLAIPPNVDHYVSLENEVVDALNSLAESRQAQAASLPVSLAQSCSLNAMADAAAHSGPPPEGLDGPTKPFRGFGLLEVALMRSCTSLRWTLALWPHLNHDAGNFCVLSWSMVYSN